MVNVIAREPWDEIRAIVEQGDPDRLDAYLDTLTPAQVARAISLLDEESQSALLTILEPEDAADLIEELPDAQGADLIEDLPARAAAAIVDEMVSDDRVDLLSELDEVDLEAILKEMDPEEAVEARRLLTYPPDTAGGIMITEFLAYPKTMKVADVLNDLRAHQEEYSDYSVQYAYVLSEQKALIGVVPLRDLVLAPSDATLASVMVANPVCVMPDTPLTELEQIFDRYTFIGVPVIDESGHLIGVVLRAYVEETYGERSDKALMRFGGIIGGDELRTMSVMSRSARRMSWLGLNLMLSIAAASVIIKFEGTVDRFIALAFFLPVIGNMSGCSGNQAVAVSIRELALGVIQPQDFLRVLAKELQVGLINGIILGVLLSAVALAVYRSPLLGVVVGCALAVNTLVALSLGGLIPLVLRRLRMDPALAAPPIVTTLSDLCGFTLALTLAYTMLGH